MKWKIKKNFNIKELNWIVLFANNSRFSAVLFHLDPWENTKKKWNVTMSSLSLLHTQHKCVMKCIDSVYPKTKETKRISECVCLLFLNLRFLFNDAGGVDTIISILFFSPKLDF